MKTNKQLKQVMKETREYYKLTDEEMTQIALILTVEGATK